MFVLVFTILLSIKHYNSQSIGDLITPKCNSNSISYTILANLSEYLENEKNIDGRELYQSVSDLTSKKVGTIKDFYINQTIYNFDSLNGSYDSYESLVADLSTNKIDAILTYGAIANDTQMTSNDLSRFVILENFNVGFGVQKDNTTIRDQLNEFRKTPFLAYELYSKWVGINYQIKYIDKNLTGNNGTLNIIVKDNFSGNCKKDENGEFTGSEIELLY